MEDTENRISIIVPVYNCASYLQRCLDSICGQTFRNLQIILVDDGSTDASGAICDRCAAEDARVQVIHQENGGIAAARNCGLKHARGPWLLFVDSDDWIAPELCATALDQAERHQLDVLVYSYKHCPLDDSKPERGRFPAAESSETEYVCDGRKAMQYLTCTYVGNMAWNKLWKRELFDGIQFPMGVNYEDIGTICQVLYPAERVGFLNQRLYFYNTKNAGSIMHHENIKNNTDSFLMWDQQIRFLESHQVEGIQANRIAWYEAAYRYLVTCPHDRKDPVYRRAARTVRSFDMRKTNAGRQRILMWKLFMICEPLFDLVCRISGKREHPDTDRS